jgi:hypothetical protein
MTTTIVSFETIEGKVTPDTREGLAAAIRTLSDGWHKATIEDVRRGYTSTRYKYYFGTLSLNPRNRHHLAPNIAPLPILCKGVFYAP